jgi:hypothetical protein
VSADEGEWVIFFDSRDRTRLIEMLVGNEPDTIHRESRDEALGLDFDTYTESGRSTSSPMVIAIDNNIVYASTDSDHISNFIRRQRDQEPLSESIRFQNAIAEVSDDALIVGYGNGSIFDHRDFRDVIDAFKDSAEVDPRAASLAFSVTAATRGFGAGGIVTLDTGFGSLEQMITAPADIDGLAALTPEDAILFFAAAGLHDGLAEGYSTFERDARELLELYVYPFEDLTGLSIEHDLIPVLGSSYGFAFGGDDLGLEDLDPESLWFLGLLESPEPSTLKDYLELMVDEYEFICLCDSGVVVTDHADYTTVQWPDEPLSNDSLADAPSFRSTRELLPPDPSTLFFFNLAAFPEQVIADMSAEFSNDPDGYDTNLEAILGFAMAGSVDESSFSFDMVLPIDTSGTE